MGRPRKEMQFSDLRVIVDTREQNPLDLSPLISEKGTLVTGDYSVKGLEHEIIVERKSLQDLVMCCGRERERFEKEVERLLAFRSGLLAIESSWMAIEMKQFRGSLSPSHIQGSIMSWAARGLRVMLFPDHQTMGIYVARFLFVAARMRWRELQSFYDNLKLAGGE